MKNKSNENNLSSTKIKIIMFIMNNILNSELKYKLAIFITYFSFSTPFVFIICYITNNYAIFPFYFILVIIFGYWKWNDPELHAKWLQSERAKERALAAKKKYLLM